MNTVTKVLSATAFAGLIGVGAMGSGHAHASELTNQASHTVAQAQGNQNLQKQPNGVVGNAPDLIVKDQTLKYGQQWNPYQGVTATDKEDGDLTNNVQYDEGYFDGHTPGDYKINYHVEDSTGNASDASSNLHVMTQGQTDQWNAQHPNGEQPDTGGVHHGQVSGPENDVQPQPKPEPQPQPEPGQDDNQKPGQNDNTNNELPHADHSHDHDGYHDMTPHGDQGQGSAINNHQGTNAEQNATTDNHQGQGLHAGQNATVNDNNHATNEQVKPMNVATTPQHQEAIPVATNHDDATSTNKADNSADNKADHKAKADKETLPETGQEETNVGLWASILAVLGLGGIVTASKRRRENE